MRLSPGSWLAVLLSAATTAVAVWTWTHLPAGGGLPLNYLGLDGARHIVVTAMPLWLIPLVSGLVTLGLAAARLRRSAEAAAQPLEMTMIAVAGLLLVTELALIGRAADPGFDVVRPVAIAVGVVLIAVGNYLGKARRNAVFGLRTPWTLADDTVWDRTHRFTGLGMVLGGGLLIGLAFLLKDRVAIGVAMAICAALPPLAGVARSASLHRGVQRG